MRLRDFITRLRLGQVTPQQRREFEVYLENNEDIAARLCEFNFTEITELVCNNAKLCRKEYASKYSCIRPLYTNNSMDIAKYMRTVFPTYENEVLKYASPSQIERFIDFYDELKNIIEFIERKEAKEDKGEQKKREHRKNANATIDVNRVKQLFCYSEEIHKRLYDIRKIYDKTLETRMNEFYNDPLALLEYDRDEKKAMLDEIERLKFIIQQIGFENQCLKDQKEEVEMCLQNLQETKIDLEQEHDRLIQKNERLSDDNEALKSNCDEYRGIVTRLSGQVVNALYKPLSDLERIVFEIEESSKDPKDISEWLKEPLNELRRNFNCIKLNNENLTELPGVYSISIDSICEYETWANRVPVKFDDSKHLCELEPTEYVLLRTRGFSYKDNLSGVRTNKAEVIPYKQDDKLTC